MPAEGPIGDLGCDKLIQLEIERLNSGKGSHEFEPTVLDREHMSDEFLE